MKFYLSVLKNYTGFSGRSSRSEYWMFVLFNIFFLLIAGFLDNIFGIAVPEIGSGPISGIYLLAVLIPGLAVAVRRLHDVGKSGAMILISLVPIIGGIWLLILLLTDSNSGENKYGINPNDISEKGELIYNESINNIIFIFIICFFLEQLIRFLAFNNYIMRGSNYEFLMPLRKVLFFIITVAPIVFSTVIKNKSKRVVALILSVSCLLYYFWLW